MKKQGWKLIHVRRKKKKAVLAEVMSHYNSHQSSVSSSNILKLFFCLKTKMWLRGFHIFFLFTLSALVKREHSAGNFQYVSVVLLPVCLLCKNLFDLCFFNPHKKQIYAVKLRYTEVPATHVQQVCWYQGEHARSAEKFRIIIIFYRKVGPVWETLWHGRLGEDLVYF